jgi:chromosome segregation protein
MHLKALEIQGFKSFPERTVINFHEGVTAIIGPNGSGKSNVTDAIRWVLGEQSVKTLRGSRMEDVIFTGTQSRRAMSFAEVTMVIDNNDNKLPLDYTEIQITRRLYRSGESEYLLNKTVCRLRDIARLFMDTGLGRDGYSIVGQGRVDEILSHRSEDRRRIFEEASGIVKYKSRKEEAERKLQSTEQNLLRINDLITELESRLEPLEAQSETARRYVSLSDDLKKTEIALILDSIDQQKEKLDEADQEKQIACADLAEANLALTSLREKNQQTTADLRQMDDIIGGIQENLGKINNDVNDRSSRLALHDERIRHLQEQLQSAAAEEQELAGNLTGIDTELAVRRGKAEKLHKQQALYRQRLDEAEAAMQAIMQTLDAAEKLIEADKLQLDHLSETVYESKSQLGQTRNQITLIDSRRRTISQELMEMASDLDRLRLLQEETQGTLADLQQERQTCEAARAARAAALEDKRTSCNELSRQLEQQRQALRNQTYRHKTLLDLASSHEGYGEAIKQLLLKADQDADFARGIRGTVGSLLRADKRCELAIETALGPAIANIVTDRDETASRLIAFLKQSRSGRATFLPLNAIRGRRLDSQLLNQVEKMPGFIGLGCNLVQAEADLQPVVDFLLGRVVITQNIDQAIAMARRIQYACRIVTLEGDVLNPGGSMTGGFQRQNTSGLLGRNREIEELALTIRRLTDAIGKDESVLAEQELKLQELARQTAEDDHRLIELSHLRVREEARLASQTAEHDKISGRQQLLQAEDEQLQQHTVKINAEITAAEQDIATAEQSIAGIRERIGLQEGANREDREKRDDLRDEITQWRVSLQSIDESLQAADEMIQRIEQDRSGQQSRLQRRKHEQADNQAEIDRLMSEKIRLAEEIDQLKRQGSSLADEIRRKMDEKNRLESEQSAFFDDLEAATARISALQGEIGRIEARAIRFEGLIDDAKNRLWEAYELTADQAGAWRQSGINRNEMTRRVGSLKSEIKELGTVNLAAIEEFESVRDRCTFLSGQRDDIEKARHQLTSVINDLTEAMKKRFVEHFHLINENFSVVFAELFGGGMAELNLEDEQDVLACGIEIKAQPPGKKLTNLLLLSGGERCLTAIALLFAILKLRPTPFCVLDEVEAALDDANVLRFTEYIRRYARDSQFILVTHRKGTMEAADRLYGVTMQERGISRILSMKLTD